VLDVSQEEIMATYLENGGYSTRSIRNPRRLLIRVSLNCKFLMELPGTKMRKYSLVIGMQLCEMNKLSLWLIGRSGDEKRRRKNEDLTDVNMILNSE
jgi:hypothetical protein